MSIFTILCRRLYMFKTINSDPSLKYIHHLIYYLKRRKKVIIMEKIVVNIGPIKKDEKGRPKLTIAVNIIYHHLSLIYVLLFASFWVFGYKIVN